MSGRRLAAAVVLALTAVACSRDDGEADRSPRSGGQADLDVVLATIADGDS